MNNYNTSGRNNRNNNQYNNQNNNNNRNHNNQYNQHNNQNNNNRNNNQYNNQNNNNNNKTLDYQELTSDNYVDYAQSVIRYLNSQSDKLLTTSQIRNMLSLNSEIYNMVIIENQSSLSDNVKAKLQYLKVRMVYDSGREEKVMAFVVKSNLIRHIDWIDGDKERYILFSKYMEALVAFRKFEGNGTDK